MLSTVGRIFCKFREENLEHARELLKEKLAEYIAFKGYSGIVVFDARKYRELHHRKKRTLEIVFTKECESAVHGLTTRI